MLFVALLASLLPLASATVCAEDNCLRAVMNPTRLASASEFCASFTVPACKATTIPSYLGNCHSDAARVSSACSCQFPAYTPTVTVTVTAPAAVATAP
ncbi:hypothetical protein NKR19_g1778 [Coniochaeta hoffmannii]|uniref:Extracellular membrane protein CFEM domain-containing protein n=1 Tax=Coniochaeta hoffmannii TaxID=91930 RepID=A0AA38VZN8_9PEZI|nr:hypothetical protein NKR19_g1778 [Coniochaeta hoffmannii]